MPCASDLSGLQTGHMQLNSAAHKVCRPSGVGSHKAWSANLAVLQTDCLLICRLLRRPQTSAVRTSVQSCAARGDRSVACTQGARAAALEATNSNGGRIPPFPGLRQRIPSSTRLSEMGSSAVSSPGTSGMPPVSDARGQPAPASRLRRSSGFSEDGNPVTGAAELQQGGLQGSLLHQQVCYLHQSTPC